MRFKCRAVKTGFKNYMLALLMLALLTLTACNRESETKSQTTIEQAEEENLYHG
jgi:hypothetical protein